TLSARLIHECMAGAAARGEYVFREHLLDMDQRALPWAVAPMLERGNGDGCGIVVHVFTRQMAENALQVVGIEASMFRHARQHARADFLTVVEGKHEVGPSFTLQGSMLACLPLDAP